MRLARPALVLSAAGLLLATTLPALASTPPDSGTLSPSTSPDGVVTASWSGTISGANASSDCNASASDSLNDHHTFTLSIPSGFYSGNHLTMQITETATAADSILTVNQGKTPLHSSDNGGVGGAETYVLTDPPAGSYDAITCAFAGASPYTGSVTLTTQPATPQTTVGGTSTTAGPSTYGNYSLEVIPGAASSGEPSIGVDWGNGNVYFQANTTTIKAKFPSYGAAPALTDVSCLATTLNTLDPILYADSQTGRVGVSQLQANPVGLNSITNFFDSSTDPTGPQTVCMPSQGGGVVAGPDHQTLGGGVYPKTLPPGAEPLTAYPHAFYYCSQTIAAGALCSRSDNGGTTFTNGVPPYTTECGGLHGHVRVGPEGTVYLPNKSCGATQGLLVSQDAGQTWTLRPVTGTTVSDGSDPSVAADRAGTVYFASTNSAGKPEVSVSTDHGKTWAPPVMVGDVYGINKAVFPEVIAGDAGRAAVAFVGSPTPGDRNLPGYGKSADGTTYTGGTFDLYVATTVDGGATWHTQDVTPNDPVQRGQICTNGTTCTAGRNLLDFNDITVDKAGHVLVAYADGCTGACVTSTKVSDNTQSAVGVIARQIDGPLLFGPLSTTAGSPPPSPSPSPTSAPTTAPTTSPSPSPSPSGSAAFAFRRLSGSDRYATAAAAAATFGQAATALLANGETGGPQSHFPDALAGAYLGGNRGAPTLLTARDSLPAATLQGLRSLKARQVIILGGAAAVSPAVETQLNEAGFTTTRIAGATRYDTAKMVAETPPPSYVGADPSGQPTAVVASGENFPDALIGGPLGYHSRFPVLITASGSLSPQTRQALQDLHITHVLIPGGTAAVSAATQTEIENMGITVQRFAGATRSDTAAQVADFAYTSLGYDPSLVSLARGDAFPDSLAGGSAAGFAGAPLLLAERPDLLGTATESLLRSRGPKLRSGLLFGGTAAISQASEDRATADARGN